ncbi:MAG: PLP-dependent transferase [Bdellovibrionales bacterium]|nr:PLP-dependent transferase [Ramlibacter sp.]
MSDLQTRLIHHPYTPPEGFAAPQPGVYKASTVIFANVAQMRARDWQQKKGYTYGLHGTPTTFTLEERLCELEGGKQCVLSPSGLSAIAIVNLAFLKTGDEVLLPNNAYGPNKVLAENELKAWGINCQFYDSMNPADLAARIGTRTRLVWLEAAGSVTMEFPDLPALAAICRAHKVTSALDNTWGAGIAFAPFEAGVDISAHALTKYPSGGGDVLMGSVITRDEALHLKVKAAHMRLGYGVGANDVEAVLRSLPSIELRYRAHDVVARALATWLKARDEIVQVLHPALEGSPGHANWQALCGRSEKEGEGAQHQGAAAGLFSVVFDDKYSTASVDRFCDALKLFKLGYSWGGPLSLVVPYDIASMRDASVAAWPYKGVLVRFSIGFESEAALRADLEQALALL